MTTPAPTAPPVQKGLEGVVASETRIADVDGARCQLSYRGYGIDELAGKVSYEEVSFLLLRGHLPTRAELSDWTRELVSRRALEPETLRVMQALPAMKRPTVSKLWSKDQRDPWWAVETVIEERQVKALLPKLKDAGAQDIIEYPLNKVIY